MENKEKYPLLSTLNSPADLRELHEVKLPAVCRELRSFIIDSLANNPGHFASSLGAVELTVALHYVFSTPKDKIVWDVGHQAYGHKILTGRRDRFHTNRKFGGIKPFPSPEESEYDSFIAGHASNSISAALGLAIVLRCVQPTASLLKKALHTLIPKPALPAECALNVVLKELLLCGQKKKVFLFPAAIRKEVLWPEKSVKMPVLPAKNVKTFARPMP